MVVHAHIARRGVDYERLIDHYFPTFVPLDAGGQFCDRGESYRTAIFALPGSEHAVTLAMDKLVVPELGHVVRELRR